MGSSGGTTDESWIDIGAADAISKTPLMRLTAKDHETSQCSNR
jgi:hypothetical protein